MLPAAQAAVFNDDVSRLAALYTNPLKLRVGDQAPDFVLPNAKGEHIHLGQLLSSGAVVVVFYRGAWCPYCNLQVHQLQQALPEFDALDAQLLAISPMQPDNSLSLVEQHALGYEVLSDVGNVVARQFTTVFQNADAVMTAMGELGYDLASFYGVDSPELPVPATFVIDRQGVVRYAFSAGGDYRLRAEPAEILAVLADIASPLGSYLKS